ncbi:hypothetical protein Tco_1256624 [Tanacetum coccineum]
MDQGTAILWSSLKYKERDKTKVCRNSGKPKEKSKKRICKEANEDFNVTPHAYENLTEFEDDEEDDEYQNNLNLICASLGITLDGMPAHPITDVFGDFLHDTNGGDSSSFLK